MSRLDAIALSEPISEGRPCGSALEDTKEFAEKLAEFDALRLFGQPFTPEEAASPPVPKEGEQPAPKKPLPNWIWLRDEALELLKHSKDLRVLSYLGVAVVRTDGLPEFAVVLSTAALWLDRYWAQVYPLLDGGDAMERRNVMNWLADPTAVVKRVRLLPVVRNRNLGELTVQRIEEIEGRRGKGAEGAPAPPAETAARKAFAELEPEALTTLHESVANAARALSSIDDKLRGQSKLASNFATLRGTLGTLERVLGEHVSLRTLAAGGVVMPGQDAAFQMSRPTAVGAIGSREDAVQALQAVADFFRRYEPSSPVPLFVERAQRLVAKSFLEVLEDVAPEAVVTARTAGGLKQDQ